MPNGFPAFPQSRFPYDQPPTLFHPASPKVKPAREPVLSDTASVFSISTIGSTGRLIKSKFSWKDHQAREQAKAARKAADEKLRELEAESQHEKSPRESTASAFSTLAMRK